MSKSKPPTKPWVEAVGFVVADALSESWHLPFMFEQAGPYSETYRGIVFNDKELRAVKPTVQTDTADFRFGFVVWRDDVEQTVSAGFDFWNKAIARACFIENVRTNASLITKKLLPWFDRYADDTSMRFDQEGSRKELIWNDSGVPFDLGDELTRYGDLERKSTGKHKDRPGGNVGSRFRVLRWVDELSDFDDEELEDRAEFVAGILLTVFDELGFLYKLLRPQAALRISDVADDDKEPFDLGDLEKAKERLARQVDRRLGQSEFRDALLHAYQWRCAVTGCEVKEVLQAAHLIPHTGVKSQHCANGILLRADVHDLFDEHLMAIDPDTRTIRISDDLRGSIYAEYEGKAVFWPNEIGRAPHPKALAERFRLFVEKKGNDV